MSFGTEIPSANETRTVIHDEPIYIDLSRQRLIEVNGLLPNGDVKLYHLKVTANKRLLLV